MQDCLALNALCCVAVNSYQVCRHKCSWSPEVRLTILVLCCHTSVTDTLQVVVTSLAAFSPVTSPPPRKHVRSRSYKCLNLPTFCSCDWARCIELYTDWYLTFEADICFFHFHFIWSGHAGFWVWGRRNWTMVLVCLFGLLYQLQEEISVKRNNATTQNKLHFYCHVVGRITWK